MLVFHHSKIVKAHPVVGFLGSAAGGKGEAAFVDDTGGTDRGAVYVLFLNPNTDFVDAPATFPTLRADNGARHIAVGATLGATRDVEPDGQPTATANGDDPPLESPPPPHDGDSA